MICYILHNGKICPFSSKALTWKEEVVFRLENNYNTILTHLLLA